MVAFQGDDVPAEEEHHQDEHPERCAPATAGCTIGFTAAASTPPRMPVHPSADQIDKEILQSQGQNLTLTAFHQLAPTDRFELHRNATADTFAPLNETEAENVDWLATALNMDVPMKVVRERAAATATATPAGTATPAEGEEGGSTAPQA